MKNIVKYIYSIDDIGGIIYAALRSIRIVSTILIVKYIDSFSDPRFYVTIHFVAFFRCGECNAKHLLF